MRKTRFLKFVITPLAAAVVLLVLGYHFVTSSWFLSNVVLDLAGKSAGMTMSAEKIRLSLWRGQLEIHKLSIGKAEKPWLTGRYLAVSFELRELLGGNIKLSDILLDGIQAELQRDADGNWNLVSGGEKTRPDKKTEKAIAADKNPGTSPVRLDLTNVKVTNSSFKLATGTRHEQPTTLELSQLHITLPSLRPGDEARLTVRSRLGISSGSDIEVSDGVWQAHLNFTLNDRFIPEKLNLMSNIDELSGNVGEIDLADNNLALLINSVGNDSGIEVNNLILRQVRNDELRSSLAAEGAIQFSPFELKLAINVNPLAEEITAIVAGFSKGINPGMARLRYRGEVDYRTNRLKSSGELALHRSGDAVVGGKALTLPPFELTSRHDIELDLPRKTLLVQQFNTEIFREKQRLVAFHARRPFSFNWEKNASLDKDSAPDLTLQISNFDLSLLHLLLAPTDNFTLRQGTLDAELHCRLDKALDGLVSEGHIVGRNIGGIVGGVKMSEWGLEQQLRLRIEKFDRLILEKGTLGMRQAGRPLVTIRTEAGYRVGDRAGNLKIAIDGIDRNVVDILPLPTEQRLKANEIMAAIALTELRFRGDYDFDAGNHLVRINESAIMILQQDRAFLECALKPATIDLKKLPPSQQFQLAMNSSNLPLEQFNHFLGEGTRIDSGTLSLAGEATANIGGNPLQLTLGVSLNDVALATGGTSYQGLGAVLTADLKLEKFKTLHINQSALKISNRRLAATALSSRGKLDFAHGKGVVDLRLDYLNSHLLNLLSPDRFTRIESTGAVRLEFDDDFKTLAAVGNIDLAGLEMRHSTSAITGNITANIRKTPELLKCERIFCELRQGRRVAARLEATGSFPVGTASGRTDVRIDSDHIDLALVQQLFSDSSKALQGDTSETEARGTRTRSDTTRDKPAGFDFGTNPFELNLDLRNITYGQDITAGLLSKITGRGKEIVINPFDLKLNGSPFAATGRFVSGRNGIGYAVRAAADGVELGPLIRPFVGDRLKNMGGLLQAFRLDVNGVGTEPPDLWDNMNGACDLRLERIVIPNEFGNTLIGGILLLPFEVGSRLQGLLPGSGASARIVEVLNGIGRYRDQLREITLADGDIRLKAGNRRIAIEKFDFTGDFVRSLSFSGSLGLGSDNALDIDSTLNVSNLIIPVKLAGTVQQPAVNYPAVVQSFLRENAINIVSNGVGGTIGTGAEGIQNVIQRTINVIRPPTSRESDDKKPAPDRKDEKDASPLDRLLRRVL